MSRRQWLEALALLGLPFPIACVRGAPSASDSSSTGDVDGGNATSAAQACATTVPPDAGSWLEVPLSSLPPLGPMGGAVLDDDNALLHVWILRLDGDCYRAVWRICTHGSCEVGFDANAQIFRCPCHHSEFALDGAVLQGPAQRPLRVLSVIRAGDSLYVERPFIG